MQCRNCSNELPPGSKFCPYCSSATPYNVEDPNAQAANQGYQPTAYAPPPTDYGAGAPPPPPYNAAPQMGYGTPPPAYGSPSQPGAYGSPSQPGAYGSPSQPGTYGAPQQVPYGAPQQVPYGMGMVPPQGPPPRQRHTARNVVIIILVIVVVLCGGIGAIVYAVGSRVGSTVNQDFATATADIQTANADSTSIGQDQTPSTDTTPSADSSPVPTSSQIQPSAAAIITSAQSASNVNTTTGLPDDNQTTFSTGSTAYVAFKSSSTSGGYAETILFRDGTYDVTSDPLAIDSGDLNGYFSFTINNPGSFTAGVYWCTKSDCSDAALAQIVTFTAA